MNITQLRIDMCKPDLADADFISMFNQNQIVSLILMLAIAAIISLIIAPFTGTRNQPTITKFNFWLNFIVIFGIELIYLFIVILYPQF